MVKLPVISLSTFYGSYEEWQFYDMFLALVDSNATLDSIQNFHYLKSVGYSSSSDSFYTSD